MFNFKKSSTKANDQPPAPPISEEGSTGTPQPEAPGLDETSENTSPIAQTPPEVPTESISPASQQAKNIPDSPAVDPFPAAKPLYPPLPTQKPRKSLVSFMFSPETSLGRFMRPFLRALAAISGLFALGLLAGYILIYQPTQRELDAALLKLMQTNQSISQKDQTLQASQSNSEQAQQTLKLAQTQLSKAANENGLLVVLVSIGNARVSLVNKDGPAAKSALEQAQAELAAIFPYISAIDQNKAELLKSRLDLAAKELVSDPTAALADLDKLAVDLSDLRKKLFK